MALIIEDGSLVENANSYVTLAEARDYLTARGHDLPADDAEAESMIVRAFDYIETLNFKGDQVGFNAFPRSGIYINGVLQPDDKIPAKLKQAQCKLSFEATQFNLLPSGDGREVIKEKVDVIEVEYASGSGAGGVTSPTFKAVDGLLKDLTGVAMFAQTLRV